MKLHQRSAEKLPAFKTYTKIEEASKRVKKGVWHDYDEAEEQRKRDEYALSVYPLTYFPGSKPRGTLSKLSVTKARPRKESWLSPSPKS